MVLIFIVRLACTAAPEHFACYMRVGHHISSYSIGHVTVEDVYPYVLSSVDVVLSEV